MISGDWHFNHSQILDFERGKKFDTIYQHDMYIVNCIKKWLNKLGPEDTFYFLGDFGLPNEDILNQLNDIFALAKCNTVAIRGNHDREQESAILDKIFDKVYDYPIYISQRIVLSHFPCAVWDDQINIHGHLHNSMLNSVNHICASIHVANYSSISDQQSQSQLGKVKKYNRRFLWEPWADKYKFTGKKKDYIYNKDGIIDLSASRVLQRLTDLGKDE